MGYSTEWTYVDQDKYDRNYETGQHAWFAMLGPLKFRVETFHTAGEALIVQSDRFTMERLHMALGDWLEGMREEE